MKNALLTISFFFVLALIASVAKAAPSYPLVCRGGAGTLGLNAINGTAVMYFQKSSGPAGNGLAAGQCSWRDRAIGQNEPPCLQQSGVKGMAWMFPDQMHNNYYNSDQAPWLRNLLKAANFQTFQVYNPGTGGCFVVTRLGS